MSEIFKSTDVHTNFDWENEVLRCWRQNNVQAEIDKLKKLPKLDHDNEVIIEMFNYYVSQTENERVCLKVLKYI